MKRVKRMYGKKTESDSKGGWFIGSKILYLKYTKKMVAPYGVDLVVKNYLSIIVIWNA